MSNNNSNLCREAFEKCLVTEFDFPENSTLGKDNNGEYTNRFTYNLWKAFQAGWKAGRENIEIELPRNYTISEIENEESDLQERMIARNEALDDILEKLEQYGFKVKASKEQFI